MGNSQWSLGKEETHELQEKPTVNVHEEVVELVLTFVPDPVFVLTEPSKKRLNEFIAKHQTKYIIHNVANTHACNDYDIDVEFTMSIINDYTVFCPAGSSGKLSDCDAVVYRHELPKNVLLKYMGQRDFVCGPDVIILPEKQLYDIEKPFARFLRHKGHKFEKLIDRGEKRFFTLSKEDKAKYVDKINQEVYKEIVFNDGFSIVSQTEAKTKDQCQVSMTFEIELIKIY